MASTPGRSRASQGAQAEPAARQRSRSASPRRTPPPNLQRTYATPNQSQDAQSGVDNGQSTLLSPPHRAFQPERLHPDVTTPHPGVARLEGRRGIPATPRPVLLPESDIPTDVPLDDPFVDTPGRTPLDIEGFGLRPPPRGIPGEIVHRSPTESPIERHVRRRENRRAARPIRDDGPPRLPGAAELVFNPSAEGRVPRADPDLHDQHIQVQQTVREDTPDSAQQDWGSDRTPGSTEINHARPGFEHLPPDAGILEIDPTRVLPTIEEGRDQIRALHAQRQSYQVDERRFRHELVDRDDEIAHLQRQASEERRRGQHLPAAYRLLDQIHQRLDREHQELRQRYEVLEGQADLWQNLAEACRPPSIEQTLRNYDEMREELWEELRGNTNTAEFRPVWQVPQERSQLAEGRAQEIRGLDEARERAVNELSEERAQRVAQDNRIRELNARIQTLESRGEEQNDQVAQITTQGSGATASIANNIPPQRANPLQVLTASPQTNATQQINAPPQQRQRRRPARRARAQAPAVAPPAAPPARRLPRACKYNVKSYKEPRG
ncbi:MAG: hypothetical protein Q9202_006170 [Teloschistes flavicans]